MRTKRYELRLTDTEVERYQAAALEAGVKMAEWIRLTLASAEKVSGEVPGVVEPVHAPAVEAPKPKPVVGSWSSSPLTLRQFRESHDGREPENETEWNVFKKYK